MFIHSEQGDPWEEGWQDTRIRLVWLPQGRLGVDRIHCVLGDGSGASQVVP